MAALLNESNWLKRGWCGTSAITVIAVYMMSSNFKSCPSCDHHFIVDKLATRQGNTALFLAGISCIVLGLVPYRIKSLGTQSRTNPAAPELFFPATIVDICDNTSLIHSV